MKTFLTVLVVIVWLGSLAFGLLAANWVSFHVFGKEIEMRQFLFVLFPTEYSVFERLMLITVTAIPCATYTFLLVQREKLVISQK